MYYRFEADGETLVYTRTKANPGDIVDLDGRGYYKVLRVDRDKAISGAYVLSLELDIDSLTLIKK